MRLKGITDDLRFTIYEGFKSTLPEGLRVDCSIKGLYMYFKVINKNMIIFSFSRLLIGASTFYIMLASLSQPAFLSFSSLFFFFLLSPFTHFIHIHAF